MTPDEVRQLESDYAADPRRYLDEEVDIYDSKGDYSHTEIRETQSR